MNKKVSLNIILFLFFAALMISLTSCNKGYGCPTNFKAVKALQCAVELVK